MILKIFKMFQTQLIIYWVMFIIIYACFVQSSISNALVKHKKIHCFSENYHLNNSKVVKGLKDCLYLFYL